MKANESVPVCKRGDANARRSGKLRFWRKSLLSSGDAAEPPSNHSITENFLIEEPPSEVKEVLYKFIAPQEEPQIIVAADMTLDGEFRETWLLATRKRVVILNPDHGDPNVKEVPLCDLKKVEKEDFVGNGCLKLITDDSATEIRFSLTHSDKFTDVQDMLESLRSIAAGDAGDTEDAGDAKDTRDTEASGEQRVASSGQKTASSEHLSADGEQGAEAKEQRAKNTQHAARNRDEHGKGDGNGSRNGDASGSASENTSGSASGSGSGNGSGNGNGYGTVLTLEALRARAEERAKQKGRCPKCGRVLPRWSSVCPSCLKKAQLLLRLFGYLKPYWLASLVSLFMMAAITAISLLPPYLSKILLDDVFPHKNLKLLWMVCLGFIIINGLSSAIGSVRSYLITWLQQKIIIGLRQELYQHLHRLSLSFYDRQRTGQIVYRVMSDTANLQGFIATGLEELLRDAMTIVIICLFMFSMNWKLALLTLAPVPVIVWATNRFGRRIYHIYVKIWRRSSKMSSLMTDAIPGIRVVKAFTQEEREVDKFTDVNQDLFHTNLSVAKMSQLFYPTMGFLSTLGTVAIWAYGGYLVIKTGSVTAGALLAFIQYLQRFYAPVHNLSAMNDRIQSVAASAERVFELIDTRPDVDDAPDAVDMPPIKGHIKFDHVSFGYDPTNKVLHEVTFEVQPGEMIGLVGHSGAGKTTLINLLCRFYDVNDGAIFIDGHEIRRVKLKSLREQIGVVLQEPYLFHGTISENIAYGKPDATREEIIAAAIAANAHDFIMKLPDGYDTMLGERGSGLSGGERQRISIARAILKNPRILIMDEATSSVDTETEIKIREAMERLVKGRTTFVIAHRFSTLRDADRIIVMEKGRIVEVGTHEELLCKHDGVFAKLWKMQMDIAKRQADIIVEV